MSVFVFLYYLQTTTKNLNEPTLDLVCRLQRPEYFLANTNAKKAAAEIKRTNLNEDDSQDQSESFSNQAKWLRLYKSVHPYGTMQEKNTNKENQKTRILLRQLCAFVGERNASKAINLVQRL